MDNWWLTQQTQEDETEAEALKKVGLLPQNPSEAQKLDDQVPPPQVEYQYGTIKRELSGSYV